MTLDLQQILENWVVCRVWAHPTKQHEFQLSNLLFKSQSETESRKKGKYQTSIQISGLKKHSLTLPEEKFIHSAPESSSTTNMSFREKKTNQTEKFI